MLEFWDKASDPHACTIEVRASARWLLWYMDEDLQTAAETTVKANVLYKLESAGDRIKTGLSSQTVPALLYFFSSLPLFFSLEFNSFPDQRGGNPNLHTHPAERTSLLSLIAPRKDTLFGAACKKQWKETGIDQAKAHPAQINKIDRLGSHEHEGVKLNWMRAEGCWRAVWQEPLKLCVTLSVIVFFIYLMIVAFVRWRRKVAWLHKPTWGHSEQSSHRIYFNSCFDMKLPTT